MDPFTIALLAASVGTATAGIAQGQMAARENRKAQRAAQRAKATEAKRQAMQQVRQRRIAEAQVMAAAAAQDTQGSSSALGGKAAIGSSMAGNIQAINERQNFSQQISMFQENAMRYQSNAQGFNALANLGLQAYGMTGGTSSTPEFQTTSRELNYIPPQG